MAMATCGETRSRVMIMMGWGAWTDSNMQGGGR